jgi:HSP20 family molecular chaperone IbpA
VRVAPEPADVKRLHQMEIATGPFERRLRIPIAFDRDGVAAHLGDGFLTVSLPKKARVSQRVEVESQSDGES